MKVISGPKVIPRPWAGRQWNCLNCKARIEFEEKDFPAGFVHTGRHREHLIYLFPCPVCHYTMSVSYSPERRKEGGT